MCPGIAFIKGAIPNGGIADRAGFAAKETYGLAAREAIG